MRGFEVDRGYERYSPRRDEASHTFDRGYSPVSQTVQAPRVGERVRAIRVDQRQQIASGAYGTVKNRFQRSGIEIFEFLWDDGRLSQSDMSEWDRDVKKVDRNELSPEASTQRAMPRAIMAGFALQIFVLGAIVWYFGPRSWNEGKVKELTIWAGLPLVSLVPWFCSVNCYKAYTVPGLIALVSVCMAAGVLSLTHCFIFPHYRELHPVAEVPSALMNSTNRGSANSLMCWSAHSGASRFHKFLAKEAQTSMGVDVAPVEVGVAFTSVMSPAVLIALGAVYYFVFIGEFDVFFFAPRQSKIVALDIVDCIGMYDTLFAHDPYFVFEGIGFDSYFVFAFIPLLWFWWCLATFQLGYEFQQNSMGRGPVEVNTWKKSAVLLNGSFFALRCFLQIRAQYGSTFFMVKNLCIMFPWVWDKDLKSGSADSEGSLLEQNHALRREVGHYRNTFDEVSRFCKRALEDHKYQRDHGQGGQGHGQRNMPVADNNPAAELERIREYRAKIVGPRGNLGHDGSLFNVIARARDACDGKTHTSRRVSIASPEEVTAKFRACVETIHAEATGAATEVDIAFKKIEDKRLANTGGSTGRGDYSQDAGHKDGGLQDALVNVQLEADRMLEQYKDKEHNLYRRPHDSY